MLTKQNKTFCEMKQFEANKKLWNLSILLQRPNIQLYKGKSFHGYKGAQMSL